VRAYFYNLMGGRILMIATGGAPTSRAVYSWMFGFGCYVAESYGIMEVGGIANSKAIKSDVGTILIQVRLVAGIVLD